MAAVIASTGSSLEAQTAGGSGAKPPAPPAPSIVKPHPNPDGLPISTVAREVRSGFEPLTAPEAERGEIPTKVKVPDGVIRPRLVNGVPVPSSPGNRPSSAPIAAQDRFVDVVAIGDATHFFCTGIVVAREWVLTARHCRAASRVLFGNDIVAAAAIVAVDRIVEPPGTALDAALLHLGTPVRIAPRPYRKGAAAPGPTGFVRLVGFGATDVLGRRGFGVKREVDIPVSGWACEGLRARSYACIAGAEMVLPRPGLGDSCRGDSGGPVLELFEGRYRLVAITSRSIPGRSRLCGDGGIYTRLDALAPWMSVVLGETSE